MLDPEYIRKIVPKRMADLYAEIEDDMLRDIARRIKKANYITQSAEWYLQKAQDMSVLTKDLTKTLAKYTGRTQKEIRETLKAAGIESAAWDKAIYKRALDAGLIDDISAEAKKWITGDKLAVDPALEDILKAAERNAMDTTRLTNTRAIQGALNTFSDIVDKNYLALQTGVLTFDQAMKQSIDKLATEGIKAVNYASGRRLSIEAAVKANIRTAANQMCAKLAERHMEMLGCSYVETTSHAGARPDHAEWQGRVFHWKEKGKADPDFPAPDFISSTGYGTATGLCGVNCRHSFYPYFPGLSSPSFEHDPAARLGIDNDELYRQEQEQRRLERDVRAAKKKEVIAEEMGDAEALRKARAERLQAQRAVKEYVDSHEYLQRSYENEGIGRAGARAPREMAAAATSAGGSVAPVPTAATGVTSGKTATSGKEKVGVGVDKKKKPSYDMINQRNIDYRKRNVGMDDAFAKDYDMTLDEYRAAADKHVQELIQNATITKRARMDSAEAILRSGRFKSQFETGTSDGYIDENNTTRRHMEEILFNAPPNLNPKERPIYGYLRDGSNDWQGAQYGEILFEFNKDKIRDRTTITFGDSLAMDHADYGVPMMYDSAGRAVADKNTDVLQIKKLSDVRGYAEVQIHGGTTIDDIERVLIPEWRKGAPIENLLKERGIPFDYYDF